MAEFCGLDSNHKWTDDCGSICCLKKHNIRINKVMTCPGSMDTNYVEFQQVFNCYLNQRRTDCNFWKKCFHYKRFKLLCSEYFILRQLSNRKFGIYGTAVRFNARNWKYPKTQAMTLDILNSQRTDDSFMLLIKKGEGQLHEVINELRKAKVW